MIRNARIHELLNWFQVTASNSMFVRTLIVPWLRPTLVQLVQLYHLISIIIVVFVVVARSCWHNGPWNGDDDD